MLSNNLKVMSKGKIPLQPAKRARRGCLAFLIATIFPCVGFATPVEVNTGIISIHADATYGGGDVVVKVTNPATGCAAGFWLRNSDTGFKYLYAMLLSAYHAGSTVRVSGENSVLWPSSGSQYCLVKMLAVI